MIKTAIRAPTKEESEEMQRICRENGINTIGDIVKTEQENLMELDAKVDFEMLTNSYHDLTDPDTFDINAAIECVEILADIAEADKEMASFLEKQLFIVALNYCMSNKDNSDMAAIVLGTLELNLE